MPETNTTPSAECPICSHSAPPSCIQCGGLNGYPAGAIPACYSCKVRGGVPTSEPPPGVAPTPPATGG